MLLTSQITITAAHILAFEDHGYEGLFSTE